MGAEPPYNNQEESDFEDSDSDDSDDENTMNLKQFKNIFADSAHEILTGQTNMDGVIPHIKQLKNHHRKDNMFIQNGIFPVVFDEVVKKLTDDMTQASKLAIIRDVFKTFLELFKLFVTSEE